jgi:hypothetical protein
MGVGFEEEVIILLPHCTKRSLPSFFHMLKACNLSAHGGIDLSRQIRKGLSGIIWTGNRQKNTPKCKFSKVCAKESCELVLN